MASQPIIERARQAVLEEGRRSSWRDKVNDLITEWETAYHLSRGRIEDRNQHWAGKLKGIEYRLLEAIENG